MQLWKRTLPYIVFTILLFIYAKHYYGRLVPSDAVSYLSIAQKYTAGNLSTAINAYWSPMVSWLIALQIKLGIPAIPAFHIIKLLSGLFLIFLAEKIIRIYYWPQWAQLACSTIIAVWAAYFTLHWLSPDALMATGLLLNLYLVLNGKWLQHPRVTGLLGAAMYFTKAFGFYFFAAHLLLYISWKLMSDRKHFFYIAKKWLIISAVFLLVSITWMVVLHQRYDKWLISSAGSYNHGLMQYGNGSVQPVLHSGLLPLPDSLAFNPWEEITLVHHYTDWKPWQSSHHFFLQLRVIRNNGWYTLQHLYGMNRLSWPAIVAGWLTIIFFAYQKLVRKSNTHDDLRKTVHTAVFVMLYCFGYAAAGVDERYLYIADIGLLFILIDLLILISKQFKLPVAVFYIIVSLLALQCIAEVIGKLNFFKNELVTQMQEVKDLQKIILPGSIVAVHATNSINAMDYWGKWHNQGGLEAYQYNGLALRALQQYQVKWVLVPDSVKQRYTWLASQSDSIFTIRNWKIYKLK